VYQSFAQQAEALTSEVRDQQDGKIMQPLQCKLGDAIRLCISGPAKPKRIGEIRKFNNGVLVFVAEPRAIKLQREQLG
jgi:hypothetical protein